MPNHATFGGTSLEPLSEKFKEGKTVDQNSVNDAEILPMVLQIAAARVIANEYSETTSVASVSIAQLLSGAEPLWNPNWLHI